MGRHLGGGSEKCVTSFRGGGQRFVTVCDRGGGGSKIAKNSVTSFMDGPLAKGLSLSSVHDSGIHSLLIPETRLLYQYSVPGSKHTFSKLHSLPRLFPISLDCLPGF